jgi:threonine dehydrogenase-like Zn-dependent dehydrogenase
MNCCTLSVFFCCCPFQGDIILRVTNTAICGSDLHLFLRGMPGMSSGDVLGHEFMGIVDEVDDAVTSVKR